MGEPAAPASGGKWLAHYVPGTIGQQLGLQAFVNNTLYESASRMGASRPSRIAVVVAASVFAILHVPNLWLVVIALPAGLFWTWHFRAHANLTALVASQLVTGSVAMIALGAGPLLHLRVGWGALQLYG